jgi:hypothetical protein
MDIIFFLFLTFHKLLLLLFRFFYFPFLLFMLCGFVGLFFINKVKLLLF